MAEDPEAGSQVAAGKLAVSRQQWEKDYPEPAAAALRQVLEAARLAPAALRVPAAVALPAALPVRAARLAPAARPAPAALPARAARLAPAAAVFKAKRLVAPADPCGRVEWVVGLPVA